MKRFLYLLLILPLIVASLWWYAGFREVPQMSGELKLPGLNAQVSVTRDRHGVPHIKAQNLPDLYRSLGFVVASERLFQMDLMRRVGRGTLSELVGEKALPADRLARVLGHERVGRETRVSSDVQEAIDAFLAGVNHFVATGVKPREYFLLGSSPAPFETIDLHAFVGHMALSFGGSFRGDLLQSRLSAKLGSDRAEMLRNEPSLVKRERTVDSTPAIKGIGEAIALANSYVPSFEGSNAWALAPFRTQKDGAILASDPHVPLSLPGMWFEAHLEAPNFEIYGHFLPLIPFAALGHNRKLGWGLAVSYIDEMDVFKEQRKEDQVFVDGKWQNLQKKIEKIVVKGGEVENFEVEISPHGPVIDAVLKENERGNFALSWTHHLPGNRPLEVFARMNWARGMDEFKNALRLGHSPGLSVVYADAAGNIARFLYGSAPIRKPGIAADQVMAGDDPRYAYDGHYYFDDWPHLINPKNGAVVAANQRPENTGTGISGQWRANDRHLTITRLLESQEKWDRDQTALLQGTPINLFDVERVEFILSFLNKSELSEAELLAYDLLLNWKGFSSADSGGALIYHAWNEFNRRLLFDELDPDEWIEHCRLGAHDKAYSRLLQDPNNSLWDVVATKEQVETRADLIRQGFHKALAWIKEQQGRNSNNWRWGKSHTLLFSHPLAQIPVIGGLFTLGPFESQGAYNAIANLFTFNCDQWPAVQIGPSTMRVVDFSDPAHSLGLLPIGNSGHAHSPFFDDQVHHYLKANHREQWLNASDYEAGARGVLTFLPAK
jgi:penicillin amidase